ncbi:AmpG family muropeptide MFS transporter [Roseococcus sp.]|uniref:AmpG family muropeptide MFS transporter n=1 Tax=Roseococcus sp. TaxID=2109646 RepID=UPI003BAC08E2
MQIAKLFRDRRFLVMLALGFAAGVPLPLTGFVLRQWFSEANISLAAIGFTALIGLSYSLKFLWAPVIDHARPPILARLGRRRGWLASIQPPLILSILALGLTDPTQSAALTAGVAVVVAFLAASQDIVVDAYRIEILEEESQGYGFACYVWGYRFALLAASGGGLALVAVIGWSGAFAYCAALVAVGFVAVLLAPEPAAPPPEPMGWGRRMRTAVIDPFADFMKRRHWLAILLFVALFKLGEALAGIMTAPFYREIGFTRGEVAAVGSVFGLVATLVGVLAGGWFVARIGTGRALVITGLAQMLSNLMYVALYSTGRDMGMLYAQVGVENFTDGLADAAFVTYLTALTNRAFSATQYALLSSLAAVPLRFLGGWSGQLAEAMGWRNFFLLTTAAALPAMCLMLWLLKRLPPPPRKLAPAEPIALGMT